MRDLIAGQTLTFYADEGSIDDATLPSCIEINLMNNAQPTSQ